MSDPLENFNALMAEFNETYAAAETEEEREKVLSEFEPKIDAEETSSEEAFEKQFQESVAEFEAEEKAFNTALKEAEERELKDLSRESEIDDQQEVDVITVVITDKPEESDA